MKIDGLEEFEHKVKRFLVQAIEKWYPDKCFNEGEFVSGQWLLEHSTSSRSALNLEHDQMINFLVNKTQCYVDRPHEFGQLMKYIAGDLQNLTLQDGKLGKQSTAEILNGFCRNFQGSKPLEDMQKPIMALRGKSGDGKTMLLAKLALYIEVIPVGSVQLHWTSDLS